MRMITIFCMFMLALGLTPAAQAFTVTGEEMVGASSENVAPTYVTENGEIRALRTEILGRKKQMEVVVQQNTSAFEKMAGSLGGIINVVTENTETMNGMAKATANIDGNVKFLIENAATREGISNLGRHAWLTDGLIVLFGLAILGYIAWTTRRKTEEPPAPPAI